MLVITETKDDLVFSGDFFFFLRSGALSFFFSFFSYYFLLNGLGNENEAQSMLTCYVLPDTHRKWCENMKFGATSSQVQLYLG